MKFNITNKNHNLNIIKKRIKSSKNDLYNNKNNF